MLIPAVFSDRRITSLSPSLVSSASSRLSTIRTFRPLVSILAISRCAIGLRSLLLLMLRNLL